MASPVLIAGRTVELYKNGVFVSSDETDANGAFFFTDLDPAADYSVKLILPTDTTEYAYTFGSVVTDNPAGSATTQGTYGKTLTVQAGVASTATFIYNKNAQPQ